MLLAMGKFCFALAVSATSATMLLRPPDLAAQPTNGEPTGSTTGSTTGSEPTPWSKGVGPEAQAQARTLLDEGNELFVKKLHRDALAKYRAALTHWNHPAIRFNVVRALLALDQPVEAQTELQQAMTFGAAPLGDTVYAEALNYQSLLQSLVATVTITCDAGTATTFDGEAVACPRAELRVRPGRHVIAATQQGFLGQSRTETLAPGNNELAIKLVSIEAATVTKTRWKIWKPWAVVGAGAALVTAGALLEFSAGNIQDDYNAALLRSCGMLACKSLDPAVIALHDSWQFRDRVGVATMATGAATLVVGGVMLFLNRRYTSVEQPPARTTVVPTTDGAGLMVTTAGVF